KGVRFIHSSGHKSFAFINARLRILTPDCICRGKGVRFAYFLAPARLCKGKFDFFYKAAMKNFIKKRK
ncbi:MAG: hypothetical protein M0Z57_01510, partial [Deltaproteobacteria bacterium]|nr:hypothetical protein [Deltaproteobacteria bacterium]